MMQRFLWYVKLFLRWYLGTAIVWLVVIAVLTALGVDVHDLFAWMWGV